MESQKVCRESGSEILRDSKLNFQADTGLTVNQSEYKEYDCDRVCKTNIDDLKNDSLINLCSKYRTCEEALAKIMSDSKVVENDVVEKPYLHSVFKSIKQSEKDTASDDTTSNKENDTSILDKIASSPCKSNVVSVMILFMLVVLLIKHLCSQKHKR